MKIIKERLTQLDNEEFVHDLFNDSNNINGNKLRTFRLFKTSVETAKYVKIQLPRSVRRVTALFHSGSLPLTIETGRYVRPQIPVNYRKCCMCRSDELEDERHFLMNCSLYEVLRYKLFEKAKTFIENFEHLNFDVKFISLMNCDEIQSTLSYTLFKFYQRRLKFI